MNQLKEAAAAAAEKLKEKVAEKMAKNPLEKALNEATADVNWNASNKVLQEIAEHTYSFGDFTEVMKHIWKRVSSDKKQWRRTLKALTLIEYLIKNGSPRCVQEFKDEIYQIRSLKEFTHYDEGQDRGAAIREKSKIIVDLLADEQKIEEERKKAQEIRERLGDISGYGSKSKYSGSGSNSYSSSSYSKGYDSYSSKDKGKLGGYGADSQSYGGGYDDTRKTGAWRVEKNEEPSYKSRDNERDNGDDYVVKSGTKYDISLSSNREEKERKVEEKPKASAGSGAAKGLSAPKGSKPPVVQQEINLIDMMDETPAPQTTNTSATPSNDPFSWNEPQQAKPQPQAQTQQQSQNMWDWGNQNNNNQQQNTSSNNNQGFNWNQQGVQASQPAQPQTNTIQNLYQQQPQQPNNQFVSQQGQFGFNNAPQNNNFQQQQQPMNNLASQMGQMSFNTTPNTNNFNMQSNTNQNSFNNAPNTSSPFKADGFEDFQTAKPTSNVGGNDYKNYSQAEKSIIDLSDFSNEANKKKTVQDKISASKQTNDGFLYSSKEELDNFFVPPQSLNASSNMNNMGAQGGMNYMGGMNQMGGMNRMGGMNQMGGMSQMGGMGQMGMNMNQMGGMSQMGGMNQMGMNMGYGNAGGNPNMGFNPMMGGNPGNFGGQMGGANYGFGGR